MKKNNNTLESTRKMNKKSSSIPALTDYIVNILSDILEEKDLNLVQNTLKEHHTYFQNIINNNVSKPKKIKDPNAPKRGKSSYIFFCLDKRQSIIDANPEMSAKEIIKELGSVWRDMSEEEKQQYENKSLADKQRYEEEMANYTPPPEIASKKDSNKPKRGKSAYIFFCSDRRPYIKEENPQLNTKEITSILGKQWKSLSNDEKQPFLELAEEDKQRYEKEKTEWNSSKEDNVTMNYTHVKKVSYKTENVDNSEKKTKKSKKKSKKKKNKKSKKKKSKKKSGYILYCQEERDVFQEDYPEMNSQEITKMLASSWKKLSKEEQDDYNERA